MKGAFAAALDATAEHAVDVYVRQREAGCDDAAARVYAIASASGFAENYLEGYETGRVQERARLKALYDDEQRWTAHRARFENRRRSPECTDQSHRGETPS